MSDALTIVASDTDPEMSTPGFHAVQCRCGVRSVWMAAGETDDGPITSREHAEIVLGLLAGTVHAEH